jgi:nucleoside 2-deoxyribosyltransferase
MQTSNPSIYVAGPINGLSYDAARERRLYVARALAPSGIEVISPMRATEHLSRAGNLDWRGDDHQHPITTPKGMVTRDRFDVERCSMMLADLEHPATEEVYDSWGAKGEREVGSLGTMTEFGWADAFGKPIVTVLKPGGVHDHPFVRALSGFIVPSLDDAIDIIKSVLLAEPLPEQTKARERDAEAFMSAVRGGAYSDGSRVTGWGDV